MSVASVVLLLAGLAMPEAAATTTSPTTLTRGVTYWRQTFQTASGHTARAVLVRVDLTVAGLGLAPASQGEQVGSLRRPVSYLADATHAVAGINADLFSDDSGYATPYGGMMRNGGLLKSPRRGREANFFLRADGTAGIGAVPFSALVSRPVVGARAAASAGYSVNTLRDAENGHITLVNSRLSRIVLGSRCTAAKGSTTAGRSTVSSIETGDTRLAPRRPGTWALIACGGTGADWIHRQLRIHDRVVMTTSFAHGRPRALVSGRGVLVARGAAHHDRTQVNVDGRNPETFACVSRLGRSVLLGVVDGRSAQSAGVSIRDLTAYLLALHCYTGMVFDGGGSTTMVVRLPAHLRTTVLNVPSDGEQRPVPNGLFVYKT
ncbi:MAG TPA: phosphodiester glycosidase family protein [Jatrophihabitans sp.]|nr:phosphodiester glycosidase family protein [Jatrophihabitans sp.]